MEVGGIDQIWYKNCIELVTSRFSADDFAPFGIIGLEPRKVSRVHNRFLQDRFQRKIETKASNVHFPSSYIKPSNYALNMMDVSHSNYIP
jgi:hypothetical protein